MESLIEIPEVLCFADFENEINEPWISGLSEDDIDSDTGALIIEGIIPTLDLESGIFGFIDAPHPNLMFEVDEGTVTTYSYKQYFEELGVDAVENDYEIFLDGGDISGH
jgi:hypothetical protein